MDIMIVLGSVTSEQYRPIRTTLLRKYPNIKVRRLEDDELEGFRDEDEDYLDDDEEHIQESMVFDAFALRRFSENAGIHPRDVVAVVAARGSWDEDPNEPIHAFEGVYAQYWPRLRSVSLV